MTRDPELVPIVCAVRCWRLPRPLFLDLLRRKAAGERLGTADIPDKYRPCTLSARDTARLAWEEGGVRNLDRVAPELAVAYLAKQKPEPME